MSDRRARRLNRGLVADLERRRIIRSRAVARAFGEVLRHHFLPGEPLDVVYSDRAIVTKAVEGSPVSSSSQPAIMAVMLEQLQLGPGLRVLEIGAGTGYNAALMASLVGPEGRVASIDIDRDIIEAAAAHLAAAGFERVELTCADGVRGWPAAAPYDRIILTVASPDVFPAWVEQLAPGGLLLLPLGLGGGVQRSVAFRRADGYIESVSVEPCGFMTLRGEAEAVAGEEITSVIPEPGLRLVSSGPAALPADRLRDWLSGPSKEESSAVAVSLGEAWGSLALWLSMNDDAFCVLMAGGPAGGREDLPDLLGSAGARGTYGLVGERGLCLLNRSSPASPGLAVRVYGDDPALAQRLKRRLVAWDAAGRPCGGELKIRGYPRGHEAAPAPGQVVIRRPLHTFLLECD